MLAERTHFVVTAFGPRIHRVEDHWYWHLGWTAIVQRTRDHWSINRRAERTGEEDYGLILTDGRWVDHWCYTRVLREWTRIEDYVKATRGSVDGVSVKGHSDPDKMRVVPERLFDRGGIVWDLGMLHIGLPQMYLQTVYLLIDQKSFSIIAWDG